ncbi:TPA: hypothetical protein ACPFQA_001924 [Citrobacter braakii]
MVILDGAQTLLDTDGLDFAPVDGGYGAQVGSGHYRVIWQR